MIIKTYNHSTKDTLSSDKGPRIPHQKERDNDVEISNFRPTLLVVWYYINLTFREGQSALV